jgi:hypothetical protein
MVVGSKVYREQKAVPLSYGVQSWCPQASQVRVPSLPPHPSDCVVTSVG